MVKMTSNAKKVVKFDNFFDNLRKRLYVCFIFFRKTINFLSIPIKYWKYTLLPL